jgi:hypothetical protein
VKAAEATLCAENLDGDVRHPGGDGEGLDGAGEAESLLRLRGGGARESKEGDACDGEAERDSRTLPGRSAGGSRVGSVGHAWAFQFASPDTWRDA